jgi:hypothetical protein
LQSNVRARFLVLLLAAPVLLISAPVAGAAYFPGDVVDPGPRVSAVASADLAADGTGGVAYLRTEGGVDHLFVARVLNGRLGSGERVDAGVPEAASNAGLVGTDGGRLLVVWNAGGRLMASSRAPGADGWASPTTIYDQRGAGRTVTNVSFDASIYGVPYVAFTVTGGASADVRSARMIGSAWVVDSRPLDVNPAANAGDGALKRPDVAANDEGTSFMVWGETGSGGRSHVFGRRVTRNGVASTVREISLPSLDGRPGLGADSAEMTQEFDSSYGWVVFRQRFADGAATRSRTITRRLVASDFDPPVPIDNLGFPAAEGSATPRVSIDGRGRGLVTSVRDASFATVGALIRDDAVQARTRLDSLPNAGTSYAVPSAAEGGYAALAWQRTSGPGLPAEIRARTYDAEAFGPEALVSLPQLGSADASRGLVAASDRPGNSIVAFVQGAPGARRLVVAVDDRPPNTPRLRRVGGSSGDWLRDARPTLSWSLAPDQWGGLSYQLYAGPVLIDTTTQTSFRPPGNLPDGLYPLRVAAVDQRGQRTLGPVREVKVDTTKPTGTAKATRAVSGRRMRLKLKISDLAPASSPAAAPVPGSGVVRVKVDFGDRSRRTDRRSDEPLERLKVSHVFRRTGSFRVTVRLYDRAGNMAKVKTVVRVSRRSTR